MESYQYISVNQVPIKWRTYKSAKLNLQQINSVIKDAADNPVDTENGPIPSYGSAKARFAESHEIVDGFWVRKGDSE